MSSHSTRLALLGAQHTVFPAREGVVARLRAMLAARRTRLMIATMDDHTLADIGIGRGDAIQEASRPMWDLSENLR